MTNEELQKYIECVENKLHDRDEGNIQCQARVDTLEKFTLKMMQVEISVMRRSIFTLQMACFSLAVFVVCLYVR